MHYFLEIQHSVVINNYGFVHSASAFNFQPLSRRRSASGSSRRGSRQGRLTDFWTEIFVLTSFGEWKTTSPLDRRVWWRTWESGTGCTTITAVSEKPTWLVFFIFQIIDFRKLSNYSFCCLINFVPHNTIISSISA